MYVCVCLCMYVCTYVYIRSVPRLLVIPNVVPSPPIPVILMMYAIIPSETSFRVTYLKANNGIRENRHWSLYSFWTNKWRLPICLFFHNKEGPPQR
jgi:hypothetical protein